MISYYFQLFQSNIINFCLELFIYPNLIIDIIFQKFYFNVKKITPFQRTSLIPNKRRIRSLGRRTSFVVGKKKKVRVTPSSSSRGLGTIPRASWTEPAAGVTMFYEVANRCQLCLVILDFTGRSRRCINSLTNKILIVARDNRVGQPR